MTAIRGHVEPSAKSGALGIHSLDQFVLSVPDVRDLHHVVVGWAACVLIRPYDADMARLAIREAISADLDEDQGGEAAA